MVAWSRRSLRTEFTPDLATGSPAALEPASAAALRLEVALRLDHNVGAAWPCGGVALRQLACDLDEEFVDVGRALCACLHAEDSVLARVRLRLLRLHLALGREVGLVACQCDDNVRVALALQLLHPVLRAGKRVAVGDVVHHDGGGRAAVVHRRKRVVPLLPGRVPDLKFDGGVGERHRLRQEGRADGALLVLEELAAHEAEH
mmetsp:Transcript_49940/g.114502  ORF Transcript_49940/g.114502 Transcript_49940/m.114502 type:complete len:203 (+) Transcript_49940:321-929(+)